ncbi:LamG domain-containing protein [Natrinema caseinilyticum]|uniref:LamG domain-containing protein n=1 Tax=Natrinema caseinilyticum TaxID=2961570 RepID=UPI0020C1E844|nr:LamG domain-containing protein [Natrinema caseinilyticum]
MKRHLIATVLAVVVLIALPPVVTSHDYGSVDMTARTILDFEFEGAYEDGNRVVDRSGSGNHGEYVGNGSNVSGGGLVFSPETGHVRVDLRDDLEGPFTLSVRVRNPRHDYYAGIVDGDGWRLVAPDDRYEFTVGDSAVGFTADDGSKWHHLTVVSQDDTVRLYADGELVDSDSGAGNTSMEELLIGRRAGGYQYDGTISSVTVYDRALTAAEVRGASANRATVRPILHTEAFRTAIVLALGAVALFGARFEHRVRSP